MLICVRYEHSIADQLMAFKSIQLYWLYMTDRLTKQPTPWGTIHLENLIVTQLVKKFPYFYEN